MNNIYFAENIRFLRKSRKMTQEELGKAIGKAESTIGCWEQGFRQPTVADTLTVCEYFNVKIEDMIGADLSLPYRSPNDEEMAMIRLYRQLNEEQRSSVLNIMKAMVN